MKIIKGRGRNRKVLLDGPSGSIVNAAPQKEQESYHNLLCDLLGVRTA